MRSARPRSPSNGSHVMIRAGSIRPERPVTIPIRRCIALLAAAGAAAAVALTSVGPANAQTTLPGKLLPGQATSDVLDSPTGDFELNVQLSTVTEFQIVNYQHPRIQRTRQHLGSHRA